MTGNPKQSRWFSTSPADRRRKPIGVTLSEEAHERLEKMSKARRRSRSGVLEELILSSPIKSR